jgi:hypothetical protein
VNLERGKMAPKKGTLEDLPLQHDNRQQTLACAETSKILRNGFKDRDKRKTKLKSDVPGRRFTLEPNSWISLLLLDMSCWKSTNHVVGHVMLEPDRC